MRAAAVVVLAALVATALAAPWLAPRPLAIVARPLLPPFSPGAPLGTDALGRDIAAMLVAGARTSLGVAAAAAAATLVLGALLGLAAGLGGRRVDAAVTTVTEAVQAIPAFLLALALAAVLGGAFGTVALAIALASWPLPARLVRAEARRISGLDYVAADVVAGRHPLAVALTTVLPGAVAPLLALVGVAVGEAVLVESALSFLGAGDPNVASWGGMVAAGRAVMRTAPHLVVLPGALIAVTVLCASLAGDWVARRIGV